MLTLYGDALGPPVRHVLCLGAHCDDIEIGCGGTLLTLARRRRPPAVTWVVFSSDDRRRAEARASAKTFLPAVKSNRVIIQSFPDAFLGYSGREVKPFFEQLKHAVTPDLIFTHYRHDRHQDHRLISELTWSTFRDHLILEYEIPKYDGDFGTPNLFVRLDAVTCRRKIRTLLRTFPSQRGKRWFTGDLLRSVLRLRGMECNAPSGHAEAFHCRKLVLL